MLKKDKNIFLKNKLLFVFKYFFRKFCVSFKIDEKNLLLFVKYGLIGVTGATLDFLFFALFTRIFGVNYLISNVFSVSIGIINNFILNIFFNFKLKDKLLVRFIKFYSIGIFGLLISSGFLFALVSFLNVGALTAKLLTIVVVTIVQYSLNKRISFKRG